MAYTTENGVTSAHAVAYHDDAEGASGERVDSTLKRAERAVLDQAVRPLPAEGTAELGESRARAADAELAAFEYLFEFKPYLKSERWGDANATYTDSDAALDNLIRGTLGARFAAPAAEAASATGGSTTPVRNASENSLWGDAW